MPTHSPFLPTAVDFAFGADSGQAGNRKTWLSE
jgi:hypothetical protein